MDWLMNIVIGESVRQGSMNESYLKAMNTLKWLPYHQGISVSVDQNISLMWLN